MSGLIVFIKNPELGKVKTRLAKDVGDEQALKIYNSLLTFTRNVTLEVDVQRFLFYDTQVAIDDDWSNSDFNKRTQPDGDLGDRMKHAFKEVLDAHDKAIIVGSDCPQLSPDIIRQAFAFLDDHDVVTGPTYDGGYYLLGMKALHPFVFDDMIWSTDRVFSTTRERIAANGFSLATLDRLSDVDYKEDWDRYGWEV